jgi:hypothetical protein
VAEPIVGNVNKNSNVMLKASKKNCCSRMRQKLHKTDNESINILILKLFNIYCTVGQYLSGNGKL